MPEYSAQIVFSDGTRQDAPAAPVDTPLSQLYTGALEAYEQLEDRESAEVELYVFANGVKMVDGRVMTVTRLGDRAGIGGGVFLTRRQLEAFMRRGVPRA